MEEFVAHADFGRRFGHHQRFVAAAVGRRRGAGPATLDHEEVVQLELRAIAGPRTEREQFEGGVGGLVLEAARLHLLDAIQQGGRLFGRERQIVATFLELDLDVAPTGELGDEHAAVVADLGGFDVLVMRRVLDHRGDVVAGLVCEGGSADVGGESVERQVGQLGDEAGCGRDLLELVVFDDAQAHLELEIGDDRGKIGIAAALAVAVETALHLLDARADRGQRVGHGQIAIVVRVDAEFRVGYDFPDGLDRFDHLVSHRAAVGVAEDQVLRAGSKGGADHVEGVVGVLLVAVEEVLGVEVNLASDRGHVLDRFAHHREVFLARGVEHGLDLRGDRFADESDDRRLGLAQGDDVEVRLDIRTRLARAAEGDQLGPLQRLRFHPLEERLVLLVRAGEAALDVVHTERVEPVGDGDLVLQ